MLSNSAGTFEIGYTNSSGQTVPYAAFVGYSDSIGSGASGTAFNDGYSFNSSFVNGYNLSFSQFQSICQSGGNGLLSILNNVGLPNDLGSYGPTPIYAPGTAYKTSSGAYVCGNSSLVSGSVSGAP